MLPPGDRLDVVLFGATGVTGGNAIAYLGRRAAALDLTWGVAGRRPQTLMQRAAELPVDEQPLVLEADLDEPATIREMAASARVVINAVGPYRRSAEPVIGACIEAGAHYLDLTGETDVVADMIRRFDAPARDAGVRIIQTAGYEALPFDLAVAVAIEAAAERGARLVAADAIASFALPPGLPRLSDGVSGGTYASTVAAVRGGQVDALLDPASLLDDPVEADRVRDHSPIGLLPRLSGTSVVVPLAPTPFANPPIIHRTASLLRTEGSGPPPDFRYREGIALGDGLLTLPVQLAVAAPIGAATAGAAWLARLAPQPLRAAAAAALERIGPDPGAGPREDRLEGWRWRLEVLAEADDGTTDRVVVDADGHPGYLTTARMLAEAALLLADDEAHVPDRAGHLTPALALGTAELDRFSQAGVRIRTA